MSIFEIISTFVTLVARTCRGPIGSRFYGLNKRGHEGILGKNTSLHNMYLIFI